MDLPLDDGTNWEVPASFQRELVEVYSGFDLSDEFAKMKAWLIGNPDRRKTKRGVKRFIVNWLNKAFDGRPRKPKAVATCSDCSAPGVMRIEGASYCARHGQDRQEFMQRFAA